MLIGLLQSMLVDSLLIIRCKIGGLLLRLVDIPSIQGSHLDIILVFFKEILHCSRTLVLWVLPQGDVGKTDARVDVIGVSLKQTVVHLLRLLRLALSFVSSGKVETDGSDER